VRIFHLLGNLLRLGRLDARGRGHPPADHLDLVLHVLSLGREHVPPVVPKVIPQGRQVLGVVRLRHHRLLSGLVLLVHDVLGTKSPPLLDRG
jgi:hypothetical protein